MKLNTFLLQSLIPPVAPHLDPPLNSSPNTSCLITPSTFMANSATTAVNNKTATTSSTFLPSKLLVEPSSPPAPMLHIPMSPPLHFETNSLSKTEATSNSSASAIYEQMVFISDVNTPTKVRCLIVYF